jgi:lipopolysaccharide export system permease protein
MIFGRSLIREFGQVALTVGAVLLAITFTTQIIRLLGKAAGGSLPADAVMVMLGFGALNYLPVVISLTLFISILLTLSRCYRDSEMVVWFANGKSLVDFVRPVLLFALPLVLTVAGLSLFLSPWALKQSAEYANRLDARSDVSRISSGVFRESKNADRVFFVESVDLETNKIQNVFVQSMQHQKLGVVVAEKGFQETMENGDKFVVLQNGRRYEGTPGQADYRIVDFERYAMRIENKAKQSGTPSAKTMSPQAIFKEPTPERFAELHWRIGLPVSVLILSLLAIPLSYVNPRAGRSANLILAILIYMTYSNLMSITQAWVAQGKLSPAIGLWPVHGLMALILFLMFYRRLSRGVKWRISLPQFRSKAA